jgi:Helix-turn-helix domain
MEKDRIEMSQHERDVLKVMSLVLKGDRTQAEAARLLKRSVRQVRRIQRRLESQGDGAVVHGLRGRPSNRRVDPPLKKSALALYRAKYMGFGPTLAAEKLAEDDDVAVKVRTLGQWLLADGLWTCKRRRDRHRTRRTRRSCFGEMVQADASLHDWLEGRGTPMALVGMIDDATGRALARFYPAETTNAYMDVLGRWISRHGRPFSWYSDRHGIFRAESRLLGDDQPISVPTQFSRALEELDVELILANSPQAKGRIERLWGTAQDRLVKELRLAGATTLQQANEVLEQKFLPWFNRRCTVKPASGNDAHRALGRGQELAAILSIQQTRHVNNDYTIRLDNCFYQLLAPAWPGERGGQVIVEQRLDGSMKIRFNRHYLEYRQVRQGLAAPGDEPLSLSPEPIPADQRAAESKAKDPAAKATRSSAVHRTAGRSGRTPALPCPAGSKSCGRAKDAYRPAPTHPWRRTG